MTGSSSFPSDRWRGPTIKQEQKSLSQPKPRRVVLIVCSGAVGIAYLIAAITNFPRKDGRHLSRRMRNKERDSSPRSEQIGGAPAESAERPRRLANATRNPRFTAEPSPATVSAVTADRGLRRRPQPSMCGRQTERLLKVIINGPSTATLLCPCIKPLNTAEQRERTQKGPTSKKCRHTILPRALAIYNS